MAEKEKSVLEQFREAYPDCLEGVVEDVYASESLQVDRTVVFSCSIKQEGVPNQYSKPKIALLQTHRNLIIPPVGITKGHRVSVYIEREKYADCDGVLVALLNHNTGRRYETGESLSPEVCLKWEDVQEPL